MRILFFFLMATLSSGGAGNDTSFSFKDSGIVDNLFARIDLTAGTTNLAADKKIIFGFLTKTNETTMVYLPKLEYFCQVQLLDESGIAVPKTWAGEKYGQQFSDLKIYSWESVSKRGHNTGGSDRPDMILPHTDTTQGRDLPPVEDIFEIKKAGNYQLSLQFQVFKMIGSGTNHTFKIVRLPPVEIPVIKMPTP